LLLLVFAVGGVAALGFLASRYTGILEGEGADSSQGLSGKLEGFIVVRRAMRRAIDGWDRGQPHPGALNRARDRALALHGIDPVAYAEARTEYRIWRAGRSRAGSQVASALERRREELARVDLGDYEGLDS